MIKKLSWTKPYCGISYLTNVKKEYQAQTCEYNFGTDIVDGYIYIKGSYDHIFEVSDVDIEVVKKKLEKKAKQLKLIEGNI